MTREEATKLVSERWERLGLNPETAPIMFGMDVDNMLEEQNPKEALTAVTTLTTGLPYFPPEEK